MTIRERFEKFRDDHTRFDRVVEKRSPRPDIHAFLLLDELFPKPGMDIVSGAEHDEIYLQVSEQQAESLTDHQIQELVRCGVLCDSDLRLYMFA